ncbi:Deoxyhypusine synthase [Clonorchis sinensis]|uniref:deoxyhypusine synthase n=1 Tax=Clonorchis sinensis TaxID=79923 RepID=A0A419PZC2_CLOSI|nr:Deoxyhypusine synthase [Clonorchis sinensis]
MTELEQEDYCSKEGDASVHSANPATTHDYSSLFDLPGLATTFHVVVRKEPFEEFGQLAYGARDKLAQPMQCDQFIYREATTATEVCTGLPAIEGSFCGGSSTWLSSTQYSGNSRKQVSYLTNITAATTTRHLAKRHSVISRDVSLAIACLPLFSTYRDLRNLLFCSAMLSRLPLRIFPKPIGSNCLFRLSTKSNRLDEGQQEAVVQKVAKKQQFEEQLPMATDTKPNSPDVLQATTKLSVSEGKRPPSTAVAFVPWTLGRLLQEMNIRKLPSKRIPNEEQSFSTLLRNSPFVQMGDFDSREVIGVVIENVNDTDLYIDFGGKFHCVCPQPANQHYPRGSLVRIRLRDPEMTNKFMINTKGISLCEADATLLGPYRGRIVRNSSGEEMEVPVVPSDEQGISRPATENDSDSGDIVQPNANAGQAEPTRPPNFNECILKSTVNLPTGVTEPVKGYDFNKGVEFSAIMDSFRSTGFQATHFARAVDVINMMLDRREEKPETELERKQVEVLSSLHPLKRPLNNCTIFLGYTSNMVSCGVREVIRFLAQHNMVDVLITSAGGVEEDFVKCLKPSYVGDFERWSGHELRELGVNRIGNLLVPNSNYVEFEAWLSPILDRMLYEQETEGINWTPSKLIDRLGKEINNPESIYYWCHVNRIPVFCPGITDGSLGDILFSHTYKSPGFRLDIVEDVRHINLIAIYSRNTGMIVLGGGIVKHHTFNANLMRNGADFCVLVNTGHEFDGSDSGARPDEAVSWGKIRGAAEPVKICADASLIFPLLVACTFAKRFTDKASVNGCT